ncbi:MAG: hypothetical protein ACK5MF_06455 [Vibrio sp.]|uniref:hypothetical protein n=1 Tax=Vibrio sp. TaxID=678 RepID=UPI003A894151
MSVFGDKKLSVRFRSIGLQTPVRNYRDNHFKKLGFGVITLKPKENLGVGHKPKPQVEPS